MPWRRLGVRRVKRAICFFLARAPGAWLCLLNTSIRLGNWANRTKFPGPLPGCSQPQAERRERCMWPAAWKQDTRRQERGRGGQAGPGGSPGRPTPRVPPRKLVLAHGSQAISGGDVNLSLKAEVLGKEAASHPAGHILTLGCVPSISLSCQERDLTNDSRDVCEY